MTKVRFVRGLFMFKTTICAAALAIALGGYVQADILKRDIDGFEIGMNLEQVKANAMNRGCELTSMGVTQAEEAAQLYACKAPSKARIIVSLGIYSGKLLLVTTEVLTTHPFDRVVNDTCKQFTLDCVAQNIKQTRVASSRFVLDPAQQLILNVIEGGFERKESYTYMVALYSNKLMEDEKKLKEKHQPVIVPDQPKL